MLLQWMGITKIGLCNLTSKDPSFQVINAYMKLLERKHNTSSAEVLYMDSFAMSAVWQMKLPHFKVRCFKCLTINLKGIMVLTSLCFNYFSGIQQSTALSMV